MTAPDPARLHQSSRQLEGDGGRVDVEQLRGLLAAALSPLPWTQDGEWVQSGTWATVTHVNRGEDDAALIAAGITALPALLDLIRRQDAALTAVRELADDWLEGRTVSDGSKQMELIAAALASPDTTHEAGA